MLRYRTRRPRNTQLYSLTTRKTISLLHPSTYCYEDSFRLLPILLPQVVVCCTLSASRNSLHILLCFSLSFKNPLILTNEEQHQQLRHYRQSLIFCGSRMTCPTRISSQLSATFLVLSRPPSRTSIKLILYTPTGTICT